MTELAEQTEPSPALERLYTAAEVAAALGISPRTVQRWVSEGRMPCHRPGGRLRFTVEDYTATLGGFAVGARPARTTRRR